MTFNKFVLFIITLYMVAAILLLSDFYVMSVGTLFSVFASSYDFWLIDEPVVFFNSFWDYINFTCNQAALDEQELERALKELEELRKKIEDAKAQTEHFEQAKTALFIAISLVVASVVVRAVIKAIFGNSK